MILIFTLIEEEIEIKRGQKITENFIETTKNYIVNKYQKNGFLNTKVNINTIKDSVGLNNEKMVINVDLGDRVKVNEIEFSGNEIFKSKLLKKKKKQNCLEGFGKSLNLLRMIIKQILRLLLIFIKKRDIEMQELFPIL